MMEYGKEETDKSESIVYLGSINNPVTVKDSSNNKEPSPKTFRNSSINREPTTLRDECASLKQSELLSPIPSKSALRVEPKNYFRMKSQQQQKIA
jgi:hypothetical protein